VNASLVPERNVGEAQATPTEGPEDGQEGSGTATEPNGTTPGRRGSREIAAEAEHLGQPWGEGSEAIGRNGPEEIRAATQRRLLGAFCCPDL
jgi:hypothetical protein